MNIPVTQSSMHAVYMHRTWLSFALIEPLNVGGCSFIASAQFLTGDSPGSKSGVPIRQHSRCWATYAPTDRSFFDWVLTSRPGVPEGSHKTHLREICALPRWDAARCGGGHTRFDRDQLTLMLCTPYSITTLTSTG